MWKRSSGSMLDVFQPDVLDVGDDADGGDDVAELVFGHVAVLVLDLHRDAAVARLDVLQLGRGHDLHALLLERLFEEGGDIGVLHRHHPVHHLDHRHLRAEIVVEAGEFDADRARADHQQLRRQFRRNHRVAIGPDALAVGLAGLLRQFARARAGGDDDVLGRKFRGLAVRLDRQLGRPRRTCPAPCARRSCSSSSAR